MARPSPIRLIATRGQAGPAALLTLLMLGSAMTEGIGIVLLAPLLATLGAGGPGGRIAAVLARLGLPHQIAPLLALFVALVLARAVINQARAVAALRLEAGLVDGLRARAWRALLHCDWRVLMAMRPADNASVLITSFDRIGFGVDQALAGLTAAVTLAGLAGAAWLLSPAMALAAAVSGGLVVLGYHRFRSQAARHGEALDAAYRGIEGDVSEGLAALREIKSLGREARAEQLNAQAFATLRLAQRNWQLRAGLGPVALEGGGALVLAVLVWAALVRWHTPAVTILPMVALFARALPLLGGLQQNWSYAQPALPAAGELIDWAERVREGDETDTASAPQPARAIALADVTLRYAPDGPAALDRVSLAIGARETVMIAGPSGAGKSTLADVLGGLLAQDSGEVWIDDVVLTGSARRSWRRRVAYVQQEPVLLGATLRENLLWADPDADSARLNDVLTAASAQFVADWPLGLEMQLGGGGRRISGGERQRIMLARALLRRPALLILDEATNALDPANDAAIAGALAGLKGTMAIIIIGHSGALAGLADRTIHLAAGRIIAQPDH